MVSIPVVINENGNLHSIRIKDALALYRHQKARHLKRDLVITDEETTEIEKFDNRLGIEERLYYNLMNPVLNSAYFNNHCFLAARNCDRCKAKDRCIESKIKEVQND